MASLRHAEEDITVKTIDPSACGWFDVDDHPVLTAARRERLTAARTGFDMGIPFNELNRAFDLGFKPLPWGDKGFIPTAMQPAENAGVTPAAAPPPVPHGGAMPESSRGSQRSEDPRIPPQNETPLSPLGAGRGEGVRANLQPENLP